MNPQKKTVLIIRFSAFGDVLQALSLIGRIKSDWPMSEVHFVTRSEFVPLVEGHPDVFKVWAINKADGLNGLLQLGRELKRIKWSHVYDSHNNLRSRILCWQLNGFMHWRRMWRGHRFLRRSLYRWKRFLLFQLRWNRFPQPFSGQRALLEPLRKWGISYDLPPAPQMQVSQELSKKVDDLLPENFWTLAPSAAYPLKRWPLSHWKKLIELSPSVQFVVLGGPQDTFLQELREVAPERVRILAGQLDLMESAAVIDKAQVLISNDTGLMHVAEQRGIRCVALMGPAPFGFPSRPSTIILEMDLWCRPCSKHGQGPCVNKETYQKCLVDITPLSVKQAAERLLNA